MTLSEELIWRGFKAETTIKDPKFLDEKSHNFYLGADPSADSLTIGNLAALMMCAVFVRHGYTPYLLAGGATGQIGDPKDTVERDLKPLEEVEYNKQCISAQMGKVLMNAVPEGFKSKNLKMLDNLDWFKDMGYLEFLRKIGKNFSMTQLMDRKFIKSRMGEGGSGISYAEFSYTLIQGYDFYHLYKEYGIDLQLCGADQYGNASTGISLIRKLENAEAHVWSTPLIIDPVTGRKFGKSEGNAIWLSAMPTELPSGLISENYTTVFDFYQFWLSQPDTSAEYLLKIYTIYERAEIEDILKRHNEHPEEHIAQKALAKGVTEVVHGAEATEAVISLSEKLFSKDVVFSEGDIEQAALILPVKPLGATLVDDLVCTGLVSSKSEARKMIKSGAISVNGRKITNEAEVVNFPSILKKGKNKFAVVK
ncbi:tyrosine--tRNA ligase [Candidatus Saccharibacteria bacterium]|nr:tyrosine--tRNA ligase [Candidatus Saccharibacteria bacterium]